MEPIKLEKVQAMKTYRGKRQQLLQSLFHFFLTTLLLGLFLSSPLWLPIIISSLKLLVAIISSPNRLFIACNVIVAILFGLSKLSKSSPPTDLYEDYVSRNKSLQGLSSTTLDEAEEEVEEKGLDELNRRIEDFIARVNKQRRMEARMMVC